MESCVESRVESCVERRATLRGAKHIARVRVAALAALVLLLGCTGPARHATTDHALEDLSRAPLWRVEGGPGALVHLYGSIHLGPAEGWRYPETVERAFTDASILVVEIDDRELSVEAQQALLLEHALLPDGVTLQSRLAPQTWTKLTRYTVDAQVPLTSIERFQPWMVANVLVIDAAVRRGYRVETGVDRHFLERASGKRVLPLESAEEQLALFSRMSPEMQEYSLLDVLRHADGIGSFVDALVRAWSTDDAETLETLMFSAAGADNEFGEPYFEELIFARNERMANRIAELIEDPAYAGQACFAVVGAGHLIGDRGIGVLLEKRGHQVDRLGGRPQSAGAARWQAARSGEAN